MKVSIQLFSLPDFPPDTWSWSLWRDNIYSHCFARPSVSWVAHVGSVWPCALGATVLCAWKWLGNLGARLIEQKFSQCLISGLNQYQLILKYRRVCNTCITMVSSCDGIKREGGENWKQSGKEKDGNNYLGGGKGSDKRGDSVGITVRGACSVSQKCHLSE